MKKSYLLLISLLAFGLIHAQVTVTVTNATNTTPNLAISYPSLANAITALNGVTAISGPVVLTCAAGNETAPAGGYSINFTATATAVNNVVITGTATTTITASAAHSVGSLTDAFFKIMGCDYVTIQNFTMQENAANTTNAPAGSNNMTEWGIALLRASATDGAQHNTIRNNSISLSISYLNSFGIYSNTRHAAATPTTLSDITNVTGSNSGNKVYSNAISNVNYTVVFNGSAIAAQMDDGNDIGGSSLATGNTFTNWGSAGTALSSYIDLTAGNYCIFINQQVNENVSYNTITSALHTTTNNLGAILKDYSAGQPGGTTSSAINNNTITISTNATPVIVDIIKSQGISPALSTATISINNNSIINCVISGAASTCVLTGISNSSVCGILNMNFNLFRGNTSTSTGFAFTGIYNSAAVVTTININNNQLGDAAGGAISLSAASTGAPVRCIYNQSAAATATVNINNNSIDGLSFVTVAGLNCIINTSPTGVAININNNQMGTVTGTLVTFSGVQSGSVAMIVNSAGTGTCILTIQGNDFRGIVYAVTGTGGVAFINQNASVLSTNILNNTFTNLNLNNSNNVLFITNGSTMASGASFTCNNNQIVGSFNKPAPGGFVSFFLSQGNSVSGSTITETGNNFSNVTINGGSFVAWDDQNGISTTIGPAKTISGNTFNNITQTGVALQTVVLILEYGVTINCSSNTISNISSTTSIYAIYFGSPIPQIGGSCTITSNTISGLSSTGGNVEAIYGGWFSATNSYVSASIQNNVISNLSSTAASALISGIDASALTATISDNVINGLSGSGTTSPSANGIIIKGGGTTVDVYNNKIYSLTESGAISTTSPAVNGILIPAATTVNVYNNFISDLKATGASLADAIRGINVTSTTASSTYNIYYNSIYLDAVSTGTNFGSSGIYHTTSSTGSTASLNMIDNIIVNTSAPNGTGITAAYRRSDATLTNYASASDNNLLYAGTPSATRLIYYDGTNSDQTLAAYQARVSTRDANSISLMPAFASATDLHLTTANCGIDGRGTPIAVTTDIDAATRDLTVPDIGADEFTAAYSSTTLAGVAGTAVCDSRTVDTAPSATTYATGNCDLIAKILPSGASPVAGRINVCVTRDAGPLSFNGDPYVQRHYDVEPVSSPSTATATVSMYFTDAEFVLYNTNNPAWPKLPTAVLGNADPNIANLKITQFHGTPTGGLPTSTPGNYTGTRLLLTPVSVILTGSIWVVTVTVSGFSGFYVHTNNFSVPLPITVNYLTGRRQGSNHLLNWKVTCATSPRATMTLERSSDARNYTGINTITADAARCNQPFDYTDANPLKGMNYYRLKIVDAAGKVTYSTTVALLNAVKGFDIISIAPNPVVTDNFKLNVASAQSSKMEIMIFDMQGRLVNRQSISVIAGFNSLPVHVANLQAGTYAIQAIITDDKSKVMRFVKQ